MGKDIQIDMSDLKIRGNILDISTNGNNIISEIMGNIVKSENIDKDYVKLDYKSTPLEKNIYDYGFAFFSLSRIRGRRNLNRTIKEIKRVLKISGSLIIWDIEPSVRSAICNFNINAVLPGGKKVSLTYKAGFNPFKLRFKHVIKLLQKNKYNILKGDKFGNIYYIEAVKTEDENNESNSGIT